MSLRISVSNCTAKKAWAWLGGSKRHISIDRKGYYVHKVGDDRAVISLSKLPKDLGLGILSQASLYVTKDKLELTDKNYRENRVFVDRLNSFLAANLPNDFSYILEAANYQSSFMPVYDFRQVPEYGRRSEVDDTFGWIQVDDQGIMIANSYQANSMYRGFTNASGLPRLSDYLLEHLSEYVQVNQGGNK